MQPSRGAAALTLAIALALAFATTASASDKPETVSTIIQGMCNAGAVPALPVGPHHLDLTAHLCGGKAPAAVQPPPSPALAADAKPPPGSSTTSARSKEAPADVKPTPGTSSTLSLARKALVDGPVLAALAIIALIIGIPAIVALIVAIVSRRRRSQAQRLAAMVAPGESAPRRTSRGKRKAAAAATNPTYIDVSASAAGSKSGRPVARRGTPSNL
jgi:hypothetical protein